MNISVYVKKANLVSTKQKNERFCPLYFVYMCLIQRITKCINCKCHLRKCALSFHFKFQHSFQHKKIIMHIE